MKYCSLATEDELSDGVLRKIVSTTRPDLQVHVSRINNGFGQIRKNVFAYDNAAKSMPQLVLTDLDRATCAPELIAKWTQGKNMHPKLWFRVVVRETEAWLLAHREAIAAFLKIQINLIPHAPETLIDPKQKLIALAKLSPLSERRRAIVPAGTASQGVDYNGEMLVFVQDFWRPAKAKLLSPSLEKAIIRLAAL